MRNVLQEDFQRKEGSAEELVARYPECEGLDVIWQAPALEQWQGFEVVG